MEFRDGALEDLVKPVLGWEGRRVLVTGHTGFKGSWLCQWLIREGAEVAGFSLPPHTDPALFTALGLEARLRHVVGDIRDAAAIRACLLDFRPEVVLHLAAQPLVRLSYREPVATWSTNVLGTVHLLEAIRACSSVRACIVVTSDKCYENREWVWGYREDEAMGGHDPYSASKGATELAVASWRRSYPDLPPMATARAGNVIGGGDWNADRIVTDFVAAMQAGEPLRLRHPAAIRPWQHVLEPLAGYLSLAQALMGPRGREFAEAWNFGPAADGVATVEALARHLVAAWGGGRVEQQEGSSALHEAGTLRLDCSKAAFRLGWQARWPMAECVRRTAGWYRGFAQGLPAAELCEADIAAYQKALPPAVDPTGHP